MNTDLPWHSLPAEEAVARLGTSLAGLADEEAARRLERFGENRLRRARPVSAWKILGDQFASVVVLLLAAAAVVALLLGDRVEAAAIAAVLVLNTAIGFATELRARRAMEALLRYDVPRAAVVRGGELRLVDASAVVPGDLLEIDAGQAVPADARLVHATDLRTNEAALTGESLPVSKRADFTLSVETLLAERSNMVYKGTTVSTGTARAIVTATGGATEIGRIGALVASIEEERTPLERRLDALGRRLVWLALGVAAVVAGLEAVHGAPLGLVVETGIALAVAAVPEALPAVATIALAIGLRRMARRNALVRRLPAVEALGSTTVVCTDKTRTLTSGEMAVVRVWTAGAELGLMDDSSTFSEPTLRRALEAAALASRRRAGDGASEAAVLDPVDAALLAAATRFGLDPGRLGAGRSACGLVPFSSSRKLAAAFYESGGGTVAYVKGAPRRLLEICDRVVTPQGEAPFEAGSSEQLLKVNGSLASEGLRVLAVASGPVVGPSEAALSRLAFLGFVGLADPPAPGVKDVIARLRAAGLRTLMVTGDQRLTAEAVGRELGLLSAEGEVIDGRELEGMAPEELASRIGRTTAFSRVAPQDKLAIVEALQSRGEIVAMLGDGVNDAAALKKADVGVAMGIRGTDVAKEAASIVLEDDRFETVAAAVEEGRIIYDNIRKFVFYLFSCNLAEILVLLIAGLAALPTPLRPLQILWLNLVTDTFPALALAMEPGDPDVMRRPPRSPQEALLSRGFLSRVAAYGALITIATLGAFVWALAFTPARATTLSFMTLALAQIFHLGNARSPEPVLRLSRAAANPYAVAAVAISVALQLVSVETGALRALLHLSELGATEWTVVLLASSVPALVGQTVKFRPLRGSRGRAVEDT
jgi:Ca2+-transporting ATPase